MREEGGGRKNVCGNALLEREERCLWQRFAKREELEAV
jgi:hypothetical protein